MFTPGRAVAGGAVGTVVCAGVVEEFSREGARKCVSGPAGDTALVVVAGGQLRAVEARCHHMGHSLTQGDIEELGGRQVIVCPAHRRRIDLASGACVDTGLDGRTVEHCVERQQRTFAVAVQSGAVWVNFGAGAMSGGWASDGYVTPPHASPASAEQQLSATASAGGNAQLNMLAFRQRKQKAMDALRAKNARIFLAESPRVPAAAPGTPPAEAAGSSAADDEVVPASPEGTPPPSRYAAMVQEETPPGRAPKRPSTQRTLDSFFARVQQ